MKKILLVFALALSSLSFSAEAETAMFFEPTQQDYNCCYKAIGIQNDSYKVARDAKDYSAAHHYALFHFTRAWIRFNEGMSKIHSTGSWSSVEKLNEALAAFAKASASIEDAKAAGHHMDSVSACEALVNKNRELVEKQITALTN